MLPLVENRRTVISDNDREAQVNQRRPRAFFAGSVLAASVLVATAVAQQPSQEEIGAVRSSCRSDFIENCSGVTPGGRDALECLRRNSEKLSGACRSAVDAPVAKPESEPAKPE